MVKYYGRAKERTGSVNTNQIGLNMSGCVSRVGRTGTLAKSVSMRSKCNVKFCGDVYYQGKLWATNDAPCVKKAPRTQSFNSGVGHRAFPAFKCGATCTADEFRKCSIQYKLDYLINFFKHFNSEQYKDHILCLVGEKETVRTDLENNETTDKLIIIKATNTEIYKTNKIVQQYINDVNKSAHKLGPLPVTSDTDTEFHVLALCPIKTLLKLATVVTEDVPGGFGFIASLDNCTSIWAAAKCVENPSTGPGSAWGNVVICGYCALARFLTGGLPRALLNIPGCDAAPDSVITR